jgi:hypothetical protein
MRFTVTGRTNELTRLWADALAPLVIRHPNRAFTPLLLLEDYATPMLHIEIDGTICSNTDRLIQPFRVTNVKLTYFPGTRAAQAWIAAAWGCFMQHEGIELVTGPDISKPVMDPHAERSNMDHVFHRGLPFELTPETLLHALTSAIPLDEAKRLMEESCKE